MIMLGLREMRSERWREHVKRLAGEYRREGQEQFAERTCERCGIVMMANIMIYPVDEPVFCRAHNPDPPLYDPDASGRRDGYWFACCVNGIDPESHLISSLPFDLSSRRLRELRAYCGEVGLKFGECKC